MADHIEFSVQVTPIEELTDEQGNTIKILSGEVATSLGGSGDSVSLADYSGSASVQGYKDGAVSYLDVTHADGGIRVSNRSSNTDFMFLRNTGHKYSAATTLGTATTDCIMIVAKVALYINATQGGWIKSDATPQTHYLELGWLKPNQAMLFVLSEGLVAGGTADFGGTTDDTTSFNEQSGVDQEIVQIYARTFLSNRTNASDGNALEYLAVT